MGKTKGKDGGKSEEEGGDTNEESKPNVHARHAEILDPDYNLQNARIAGGKGASEAQIVCWLASAMPLDKKIEAAVSAMPRMSAASDKSQLCDKQSTVSPRLACAVLHFAANALLRLTPATAVTHHGAADQMIDTPRKADDRQPAFLNIQLWELIESSLQAPPDQVMSTVSGVGGHLVRPIHAAFTAVMRCCREAVHYSAGDMETGRTWDTAALAQRVGAVLVLLRGPHAASFQPHVSMLSSMLSFLSADLASVLELFVVGVCSRKTSSLPEQRAEEISEAVRRAVNIVIETVDTMSLAVARAPNQRKIFSMAVDDLIEPTTVLFAACSKIHLSNTAGHRSGSKRKLTEAAADDAWRVYRRMEALMGSCLFSAEHLTDFGLAYSFRNTSSKPGTLPGASPAAPAEHTGDSAPGGEGGTKIKGKRMKGSVAQGAGGGYRGDKLKSYQGTLFVKLLALAQGKDERAEEPPQPAELTHSRALTKPQAPPQSAVANRETREEKRPKKTARQEVEGAAKREETRAGGREREERRGGDGVVEDRERQGGQTGGDESGWKREEAALMWFPEVLRLFVVRGRQAAEPDIFDFWQGEGMPLAFGEQHAKSVGGSAAGGAVGRARGGVLEAAGRDGGGEGKKRKKVNESTFGAVAEMDFCRELVHIADVATGRHMQAPLAFKEHVPSGEAQAQEAKGALLLLRVCTKILENVVLLDVYRAHLFSEAGEVKPYLRHLVDFAVTLGAGRVSQEGDASVAGQQKMVQAVLEAARHMLLIDHTAVEPHAQSLCTLAMRALGAAAASSATPAHGSDTGEMSAAAVGFLSSLSRTMSRLNQADKFIEWFLTGVRIKAVPCADAMRDATLVALSAHLVDAKWGQVPAVCEQALAALTTYHLPCVLALRKTDFLSTPPSQQTEKGHRNKMNISSTEEDQGNERERGRGEAGGAVGGVSALEALVHVSQVTEVILRSARDKALGPDGAALQQMCLRISSQVVRPLLSSCVKCLKEASPRRSTRVWCTHVGAAVLTMHTAISALVTCFPASSTPEAGLVKETADWPADTMPLATFLSLLQGMENGEEDTGGEGGKLWYSFGVAALGVAMTCAAAQQLAVSDLHLSLPYDICQISSEQTSSPASELSEALGAREGRERDGLAKQASDAASLAHTLMHQLNASLARLCGEGVGGGDSWQDETAGGVCRAALAKLPLIASFCNDSGTSFRRLWRTLLTAAASFREREARDGKEAAAVLSPDAERVYELLYERSGSGGGLYDIACVHVELVAALLELIADGAEAVLKARGGDLHEACNADNALVQWGSRSLLVLRRAVKNKGKKCSESSSRGSSKSKRQAADKELSVGPGMGDGEDSMRMPHAEAHQGGLVGAALYHACRTMWMTHPGACGGGGGGTVGSVGTLADRKDKNEKREKDRRRESSGEREDGAVVAVEHLRALLESVAHIAPNMLTMPCQQAMLVALAALEPLVCASVAKEQSSVFKDTSRALLATHLVAAAASAGVPPWSMLAGEPGAVAVAMGENGVDLSCTLKVVTWLFLDEVQGRSLKALSHTCSVLQVLALSCTQRGCAGVNSDARVHLLAQVGIVDAIRQYLRDEPARQSGSKELKDTGAGGQQTHHGDANKNHGKDKRKQPTSSTPAAKCKDCSKDASKDRPTPSDGWGRCVRACAVIGGLVSAVTAQEGILHAHQRRAAKVGVGGVRVEGEDDGVVRDVGDAVIALMSEVEEVVVRGWRQRAERGLTDVECGMMTALSAHVLKMHALRRALAATRATKIAPAEGAQLVKEVGGMLAYALRVLLSQSAAAGGVGGVRGGSRRVGERGGLVEDSCSLFLVTACSCFGGLKPSVSVEAYSMLLALLVAPHMHLSNDTRALCLRQLLLNSSRDHIALVAKALHTQFTMLTNMAASLAGEEAEEEARLVARVRTMLALLRCCVHTLSPHSRRWGPLTPHLPGILAQVSALVSLLLLPSLRCSLESKVGVSRSGGGGSGNTHSRHRSVRTGASKERMGGEERGLEEREEEGAEAPEVLSAMAVRWEVSVSAARIIALALRRSDAVALDRGGVECALQVAVSMVTVLANIGFVVPPASDGLRYAGEGGGKEAGHSKRRLAFAAGCVARGCAVVEAVEDVLYSLLARRAEEVPAALPSLMRCMAIYLDCLVFLGAQLAHLRPNSRLDRDAVCEWCVERAVECARNYARLLVELSKEKKRFSKYAAHIVLGYVLALDRHPASWPPILKDEVVQGMYAVIDTCAKFELQQVHALLSQSSRPLFQALVEDFKRSYKYTGEA